MSTLFDAHDRAALVQVANDEARSDEERELARSAYGVLLPHHVLSICPFTGAEVRMPFDGVEIDGPFWDSMEPVRPDRDAGLPRTLFSLTGGMRLQEAPHAPFLAIPGPPVPFVVPDLLRAPDVIAVLTAVEVGRHAAFSVGYFAEATIDDALRLNMWGLRSYRYRYDDGTVAQGVSELYDLDNSGDLLPWLDSGKLLWVDGKAEVPMLRSGADQCPFLGWPGSATDVQRVVDGEVTT
jgi:hypothetical protein